VALDFFLDIDLVDGKPVVDGEGVAGFAMEEAGFEVEGVGEAVGGVDAHDEGAVAEAGELQARRGGQTGLSDASLAAEQQDAHTSSVAGLGR
jgi:hypothetical protein